MINEIVMKIRGCAMCENWKNIEILELDWCGEGKLNSVNNFKPAVTKSGAE